MYAYVEIILRMGLLYKSNLEVDTRKVVVGCIQRYTVTAHTVYEYIVCVYP